jgi:Ni,Fe-hydrogenase III large subunit
MAEVPVVATDAFRRAVIDATMDGWRVSALFGLAEGDHALRILAVLSNDEQGDLSVCATVVSGEYESLTPECPEVHWFERELAEQWGVEPRGHPWLKPIRFQPPRGGGGRRRSICGVTDYFRVDGEEVHEVAVGPVHAGVIEPGHFRFQCHGEEVLHLEISLGYQHRGVERSLLGGPDKRTIHYMETLAGDTTVGHTHAYAQTVEALGRIGVPPRGMAIRGIGLELERIANHIGDLGAMAGDVGFLPTSSYCGRIRGDILHLTAMTCGSRFGRGLLRPGGAAFDLNDDLLDKLRSRVESAAKDMTIADGLFWGSASVMARIEGVGVVPTDVCEEIGLVGPAARACGVDRDVRKDHPFGIYQYTHIPTCTWGTGDVFGRAHIRSIEIQRSFSFIREQLEALPSGEVRAELAPSLAPNMLAVSLVEGWRGEICHVAVTDALGRFASYKVIDPSFHNWFGLAYALRGQQISDFPLCNKSFNLSYCGHDL